MLDHAVKVTEKKSVETNAETNVYQPQNLCAVDKTRKFSKKKTIKFIVLFWHRVPTADFYYNSIFALQVE